MKVTKWIGLAFSRPWRFFKESFFGGKELVPLEEDPVGEFLDKKKGSEVLGEEEENEVHQPIGETSQAAAVVSASQAKEERVEAVKAVAVSEAGNMHKLSESEVAEKKAESSPVALAVEAKAEESQPVNKASEEPVKTEDKPQVLEAVNQGAASSNQQPAEKPKEAEAKDTDSLLDIFRSEQGEINTLGSISEELGDMSIYSLLEEGQKIVAKIKGGHSESS